MTMNKQKLLQNLKKFGNLPVRKSKTSKSQIHIMTQPATFLLKSALCILAIATTATAAERFFTPPDAPFIIGAKDKVERITLTNSGETGFLFRPLEGSCRKELCFNGVSSSAD